MSKGSDEMKALKNRSIGALLSGISEYERESKRIRGGNFKSLKTLYEEFLKADSKTDRKRLTEEFKKRSEEFAAFMEENPELISTEMKKALLIAASGGDIEEENITVDTYGHKKVRKVRKTVMPDISAIKELLSITGAGDDTDSSINITIDYGEDKGSEN